MTNRLINISNNVVSETAILLIVFCMFGNAVTLKLYGQWTGVAVTEAIIGGIILIAWLSWTIYVLCRKKIVKEMSPMSMFIIETCSRLLALCWLYVKSSSFVIVIPFAILFAWQEYRLIQEKLLRE